jgi:integrase
MGDPWFRRGRGWYVTMPDGTQIPLDVKNEADVGEAWKARESLIGKRMGPTVKPGTIAELIPQYLSWCSERGLELKTTRDYGYSLRWLVAQSGGCAIDGIDAEYLERRASAENWSDSHKNNVLTTVQKFVRWAGRTTFSVRRPVKESRGAEAVISPETYAVILRQTTGDFHQLMRVLWSTGARPSEIAGLTVDAVDWPSGTATLKRHKMKKKGRKRVLVFNEETMTILREQASIYRAGHLFRGMRGEPFTAHAIACRFIRLCKKHGFRVTSYCFRHTFATRALAAGFSDSRVAAALGHGSTRMIHAHYSHLSQDTGLIRDMVSKL